MVLTGLVFIKTLFFVLLAFKGLLFFHTNLAQQTN
jgi:hypothetical protein